MSWASRARHRLNDFILAILWMGEESGGGGREGGRQREGGREEGREEHV